VVARFDSFSGGFDRDQTHRWLADEPAEQADRV